jgi:hypothetical protein
MALSSRNNYEMTKPVANTVYESWHFFTLKWITVNGAWQSAVNSSSGATLAKHLHFTKRMVSAC